MYRSFTIRTIDEVEWFIMYSQYHGEFADGVLITRAPLFPAQVDKDPFYLSIQQFVDLQFNVADLPFEFRIQEMEYFCKTFSLFNPKIENKNGPSSSQKSPEIL